MSDAKPPLPDLTERGALVVDLVTRYGLISSDLLRDFVPGLTSGAARKFLDRFTRSRWLAKHRLPTGLPYYVLSDSACHRLELKRSGGAFRQRPLIKHLLVLLHFSKHRHLRLLTSSECRTHLPDVYRPGASRHYFIDGNAQSLGWVCLDDGKALQRVYSNVQEAAGKKKTIDKLRGLAAAGCFRLLVLTPAEAKAEQLREAFAQRPIRGVVVEVAAVTACQPLVLGGRQGEVGHGAV